MRRYPDVGHGTPAYLGHVDRYAHVNRTSTVALAVALLAGAVSTVAEAAPPPLSGASVIAFSAVGRGASAVPHLWLMDVDTGKRWQTSSGRYGEEQPSWAPGGERLVFARTRNVRVPASTARQLAPIITTLTISTRSMDGLTNAEGYDDAPAWSPRGGRIPAPLQGLTN